MLLRDALRTQSPSLALQRAAADEIARLDALVANLQAQLKEREDARSQPPAQERRPDVSGVA